MTILQRIKRIFRTKQRGFEAAKVSNLLNDWLTSSSSPNDELKGSLKRLRARSRDMAINNDYAKRYLNMVTTNVVGHCGIKLQVKGRDDNGTLDSDGNRKVEEAWMEWGKRQNASVTGQLSWKDIQRLVIETTARDGECLIRKVAYDNDFKFALQIIEADHLDDELNKNLSNGNTIRMGIEFDKWQKPVAYHLISSHPGDSFYETSRVTYDRVPANEIIHVYIMDRPGQSRGVPWMAASLKRLKMVGGYEDAELTAARVAACKMGFYVSPDGQGFTGSEVDSTGNLIEKASPGTFSQLPTGFDFKSFDPTHPTSSFGQFVKTILRGASSGLNVSYNNLANDLEGVNFSSARFGELDERDNWRTKQAWFIEAFIENVYRDWLRNALLVGKIPFKMTKYNKFSNVKWIARGWDWVDPLKDVQANVLAIKSGLKTLTEVVGEQGKDYEDVLDQVAIEKEMADKVGVSFDQEIQKPTLEKVD